MPVLNDTPGAYIDASDIITRWSFIKVSDEYNARINDFILTDAIDEDITINLPTASTSTTNIQIAVMKVDNSTNSVTIDPGIGITINNEASIKLSTQYKALTVISDGSNWYTITVGGVGIISQPPASKKRITNMYYNPATGLPEFEVET